MGRREERVLRDHWGRGWAPPSGEETDTAMTRSEEEVSIGKKSVRRAERVRLKKVLVEDEVSKTVPVRREEIRLETDPPPEGRIESVEDVDHDSRS
jgi:stress response protein YsnF